VGWRAPTVRVQPFEDALTFALLRRHVWQACVTAFNLFVSPFALNQPEPVEPAELEEPEGAPLPDLAPLAGAG
jgi:hypothetical protein